jgi:hypothetical protein
MDTPVSSKDKSDRQDITEILLKVALNMITLTLDWLNNESVRAIYQLYKDEYCEL